MNDKIKSLIEKNRKKDLQRDLKEQVKLLSQELNATQRKVYFYEEQKESKPRKIVPSKSKSKDEGTVLALLSDIHAEEKITLEETNRINSYNPDKCKSRLENYFINLINLTDNNRRDISLDNLVLGLLGDNIHGFIHEEYLSNNYLTPPEASLFIIEQLEAGLTYLIERGKFKRIVAVCKIGNHSRTTDKSYSSNEAVNSYEWMIYQTLKKKFTQIEWIVENSYFSYFNVYDRTIRFHHGHAFKYAGGIGGLYVPLVRYITKISKSKIQNADLDAIAHWHTLDYLRGAGALVNGSVCGYNSYAIKKGFNPEPPQQQFLIVDKKRGFTINAPIILE